MTPETPNAQFAVRTARGERRRIRSFLKEIELLGVERDNLPPVPLRALEEADRFLGRYLDLLARETPNPEQLDGVMEGLGGIDRVVRNAMAEILKSLGWRPEKDQAFDLARPGDALRAGATRKGKTRGKVIRFPGPKPRGSTR